MAKTIKSRLESLEGQAIPEQPQILACESLFERGIYTVSEVGKPEEKERLTWEQVQAKYKGRNIIRLHYVNNWRGSDDK